MDLFLALLFILSGFLIGAYGTFIGVGGGFLLIPFLLIVYPESPSEIITSISLSVIFFNSLSGTISYWKMGRVSSRVGVIFALSSIPGSVAGAFTTSYIPRRIFETVFGLFLVGVAIFLNLKGFQNDSQWTDEREFFSRVKTGAILSFFTGFISALLGVGGGIIHVPILVYLLKFPVHVATATSHFILSIISLFASLTHIFKGSLNHQWLKVFMLSAGVIPGAQLGAYLSSKISGAWIIRGLTLAVLILGLRLIFLPH